MIENISNALLITVIGMGLVFMAIFLLWGGMAVLTRLSPPKEEIKNSVQPDQKTEVVNGISAEYEAKRKAAVAAVAFAIELNKHQSVNVLPLPQTAIVSAWQAVMRSKNLTSRRQRR